MILPHKVTEAAQHAQAAFVASPLVDDATTTSLQHVRHATTASPQHVRHSTQRSVKPRIEKVATPPPQPEPNEVDESTPAIVMVPTPSFDPQGRTTDPSTPHPLSSVSLRHTPPLNETSPSIPAHTTDDMTQCSRNYQQDVTPDGRPMIRSDGKGYILTNLLIIIITGLSIQMLLIVLNKHHTKLSILECKRYILHFVYNLFSGGYHVGWPLGPSLKSLSHNLLIRIVAGERS